MADRIAGTDCVSRAGFVTGDHTARCWRTSKQSREAEQGRRAFSTRSSAFAGVVVN